MQNGGNDVNLQPQVSPQNPEVVVTGENLADFERSKFQKNGETGIRNVSIIGLVVKPTNEHGTVRIIENKKRRTNVNLGYDNHMGLDSEIILDTSAEENMNIEQASPNIFQNDSKNGQGVGAQKGAHLVL